MEGRLGTNIISMQFNELNSNSRHLVYRGQLKKHAMVKTAISHDN